MHSVLLARDFGRIFSVRSLDIHTRSAPEFHLVTGPPPEVHKQKQNSDFCMAKPFL
jgi:hypothetical protein